MKTDSRWSEALTLESLTNVNRDMDLRETPPPFRRQSCKTLSKKYWNNVFLRTDTPPPPTPSFSKLRFPALSFRNFWTRPCAIILSNRTKERYLCSDWLCNCRRIYIIGNDAICKILELSCNLDSKFLLYDSSSSFRITWLNVFNIRKRNIGFLWYVAVVSWSCDHSAFGTIKLARLYWMKFKVAMFLVLPNSASLPSQLALIMVQWMNDVAPPSPPVLITNLFF